MKPSIRCQCTAGPRHSGEVAFTLAEMMVTVAILILLVVAIVSTNLFGLRMFQIEETKLNASSQARNIVGKLMDEIHSCDSFQVGTVITNATFTNGTFTALPLGASQRGTALLISNATKFTVYYVNTNDHKFRRTTSTSGSTRILAQSVTNAADVFRAQDFSGNVLTNDQVNTVLHLKLEFYQATRYGVPPDYCKLETSATRR